MNWLGSLIVGAIELGVFALLLGVQGASRSLIAALMYFIGACNTIFFLFLFAYLVARLFGKRLAVLFGPLLSSFLFMISDLKHRVLAAVIASAIAGGAGWPTFATREWQLAAAWAGYGVIVFFAEFLGALGLPPGLNRPDRIAGFQHFRGFAVFLGGLSVAGTLISTYWPVAIVVPVMALTTLTFVAWTVTRALALSAYRHAEVAVAATSLRTVDTPWCVHFTDVHLTVGDAPRAEGGYGGNSRLGIWLKKLTSGERRPIHVLVTGDVADHGLASEWDEARAIFHPLTKNGRPVLVAPGNHDLLTAYNWSDAAINADRGHFMGRNVTWLNGRCLYTYLQAAADLAPGLRIASGEGLGERLAQLEGGYDKLWRHIEEYRLKLRADASSRTAIVREFESKAEECVPGHAPGAGWRSLLFHPFLVKLDRFRELFVSASYAARWYDYFPLLMDDVPESTRFLILNSVANDLSLLGSTWGWMDEGQLTRLEGLVQSNALRRLVVLVHHAPFRWKDEHSPTWSKHDVTRWACLSTSLPVSKRLWGILAKAEARGMEGFLFCGHRHGGEERVARVGHWASPDAEPTSKSDSDGQIWVTEGASLAEGDCDVLAGELDGSRKLRIGRLPG